MTDLWNMDTNSANHYQTQPKSKVQQISVNSTYHSRSLLLCTEECLLSFFQLEPNRYQRLANTLVLVLVIPRPVFLLKNEFTHYWVNIVYHHGNETSHGNESQERKVHVPKKQVE